MAKKIKQFWALDFDRCLADTDELSEHFLDIAHQFSSIQRTEIEQARSIAESRGKSFDQYAAIRADVTSEEMERITEAFIADSAAKNYLMPGAVALLEYVMHSSSERAGAILTYGAEHWQQLKIQVALGSRAIPYAIIAHPHKSREIRSWYNPDSASFHIPPALSSAGAVAEEVILVDDKAVAFAELPDHARGYWFQSASLLPSQQGTVGPHVTIIQDTLAAAIAFEE